MDSNIPEKWCYKYLGEIANIYNGNSINAKIKEEKYMSACDGWNYIATKDIGFDCSVDYANGVRIPYSETGFKIAPKGSVLVCSEGGSAGRKSAYITQDVCFGNKLYAITNHKGLFDGKYVFYFTRYRRFFESFKAQMNGIIGGVSVKKFGQILIPFPSISEQKRIVAKIEELFSELDKGVEALQKAKMQLKLYRQAVLKDAFEGKLTNDTPTKKCLLNEYIENPRYGTSKKCTYEFSKNSVAVYRIPNIDYKQGVIDHSDIKYATFLDNELDSLRLNSNDILIIRSNGSISIVGRAALIKETDINGIFAGYLMRLRIRDQRELQSKYLLYFLSSHEARTYIENVAKSTSGVNNINSQEIGKLPLPIFPYETQMEIISAIESRLSICDKIEQIVDESLLKAESLRQSILKKAFEGKLVPYEEAVNG